MADPFTMVAMGASAASGIVDAIGAGQSAASSEAMYRYRAGLAQMNERINKQNAAWAREGGDINAMEVGMKAGQEIAGTKVAQSASGFDVNTGTGAQVRESQGAVAQFDQGVIRFDAAKQAYGYETRAAADEAEATADTAAAEGARKAGKLGILTSILGGASSVASKWSQGRSIGLFGGGSTGNYDEMGNLS